MHFAKAGLFLCFSLWSPWGFFLSNAQVPGPVGTRENAEKYVDQLGRGSFVLIRNTLRFESIRSTAQFLFRFSPENPFSNSSEPLTLVSYIYSRFPEIRATHNSPVRFNFEECIEVSSHQSSFKLIRIPLVDNLMAQSLLNLNFVRANFQSQSEAGTPERLREMRPKVSDLVQLLGNDVEIHDSKAIDALVPRIRVLSQESSFRPALETGFSSFGGCHANVQAEQRQQQVR